VLAPEGAEHTELDFVRLAAEALDDEVVLGALERDQVERGVVDWHVTRIPLREDTNKPQYNLGRGGMS